MNERELIGMVSNGVSPYALINSMIVAATRKNSTLTKEQKAEREERSRLLAEERLRQAKIVQNICPDCEGKLIRGKKDKKNNYKRLWVCKECKNSHSM